ncbi:hypothetical protein LTR53_017783 [Teratosphaeriaceae sp. CCFEE 6253]|nr:hypothetical protein LTR53_017783 [Teratosphaeriaceae sp. CCFEE 6253]
MAPEATVKGGVCPISDRKATQWSTLSAEIAECLDEPVVQDSIQLCGAALLQSLASTPDKVLELARGKLYASPYHDVPVQWRRLYEEATLHKVVRLLQAAGTDDSDDCLQETVKVLDNGIAMSGCPSRRAMFEDIFVQLQQLVPEEIDERHWKAYGLCKPDFTPSKGSGIDRVKAVSFTTFQSWISGGNPTPKILEDIIGHWPARKLWSKPGYILRQTLGGRRTVQVELGESYVAEGWGQRTMPMRDFMTQYLLAEKPERIGYLAQYDLFAQIPALRNDISVPDYCFTETSPPTDAYAMQTLGLDTTKKLDEPITNVWLGPKGTKSPLHTDPYHNILCQVVGYKYVRLYPPSETPNLYPRGKDEHGIEMRNTSQVDVAAFQYIKRYPSCGEARALLETYPRFEGAKFVEALLAPGETLYVPLGWWHYVESRSTSISVNFWWN